MTPKLPLPRALLAAGLVLACLPGAARAQQFLGKPMPQWRADLAAEKTPAERRSAAFALGKIGKPAVEALGALAGALNDKDDSVREAAAFAIGEICAAARVWNADVLKALCQLLQTDKNEYVRRSAAFALGCMRKSDDANVREVLTAGLKDASAGVRQNVSWALGRMGDKAADGLKQALQDSDPLVRRDAAKALDLLSPDAASAAKAELLKCYEDKVDPAQKAAYTEMRKAAIIALVRVLGPGDDDARPVLLAALKDPEVEIRQNTALALGGVGGPEAAPAVPILLDLLRKDDNKGQDKEALDLRRRAALAFQNIGPEAKAAVPELCKALRSPDKELRYNATVALSGFKGVGEPAVPDLVQLIQDPKEDVEVRKQAAVSLSRIGYVPALQTAMPALLRFVGDTTAVNAVRERVLWILRPYLLNSQDRAPVFTALMGAVSESPATASKMLRYDSAYLLGMFLEDKVDNKVLDVLGDFLKDTEFKLFQRGVGTGGGFGEGSAGKTEFQEKAKGDARVMAVDALRLIGAERVAGRPDIVLQLLRLEADPKTDGKLRESLEVTLVRQDVVAQLRKLQGTPTTAPELRTAIANFLTRLPALEKKVQSRKK
jgi:HEAT repeat protein